MHFSAKKSNKVQLLSRSDMSASSNIKLVVVSLEDAIDRRAQTRQALNGIDIPWAFLDACRDDCDSPYEYDEEGALSAFGRPLAPAEIGCFKSHMKAFASFDDDPDLDWLFVMEDDVWLDSTFSCRELVEKLDEWDIGYLRLYARKMVQHDPIGRYGERFIVRFRTDPYGAQLYAISRDTARRFSESFSRIVRPVDDQMGRFWENGMEAYAIFPFPACERDVPSSMNNERNALVDAKPRNLTFKLKRLKFRLRDLLAKKLYFLLHRARSFSCPT